jgi:hypothetical protein
MPRGGGFRHQRPTQGYHLRRACAEETRVRHIENPLTVSSSDLRRDKPASYWSCIPVYLPVRLSNIIRYSSIAAGQELPRKLKARLALQLCVMSHQSGSWNILWLRFRWNGTGLLANLARRTSTTLYIHALLLFQCSVVSCFFLTYST